MGEGLISKIVFCVCLRRSRKRLGRSFQSFQEILGLGQVLNFFQCGSAIVLIHGFS